MEFDKEKAENELADSRLAMSEGEFETFIAGNPTVIWDTLKFCSDERLPLAIKRVWQACWLNMQDGDLDFAEEIGRALVTGLTARLEKRQAPPS